MGITRTPPLPHWLSESSPISSGANNRNPQAVLSQTCLCPIYLSAQSALRYWWSWGRLATCACADLILPPNTLQTLISGVSILSSYLPLCLVHNPNQLQSVWDAGGQRGWEETGQGTLATGTATPRRSRAGPAQ